MKKKLSIALSTLLAVASFGACSFGGSTLNVEIPEFADTEGISFSAYSGPTVENWSGGSKNVSTITDEHFQKFVDAGFNTMLALYEGAPAGVGADAYETIELHSSFAGPDALEALTLAEKYGVTPVAIAFAWILRHPAFKQVVTGTTTPERMEEICKAADIRLSHEEWYQLYFAAGNTLP